MKKKAAIVGAGIGGLATAIRLAIKGYTIEVFEKNANAGGKIGELRQEGYRWDMGPSLLTLPQQLDELFALAGEDLTQYMPYERLDLVSRYFYEDGTVINAWADPNRFAEEIEGKTLDKAENVMGYLANSREKYELTQQVFLNSSLHRWQTYVSPEALMAYFQVYKLHPLRTLHQHNANSFKDIRSIMLFDRFATYNGSDPYRAPATLSLIPHLEHKLGAYYPQGGMFAIVLALQKLAEKLGVRIQYNAPVERIIYEKDTVTGLQVNGEKHEADVVLSNADVWATYRQLLPELPAPERVLARERSSSAMIFFWGIKDTFPQLDLHNIFFSGHYLKEFHSLWKEHTIGDDPTVYIYISSKLSPQDAPKGKENWFVMINTPADSGQDWDSLREMARAAILRKLNGMLGTNLQELIETEHAIDARYISEYTGSYQGALYGNASNTQLDAFFRHPNFAGKLKGLYFAGGSVHPGGGIPLCLLSAKIAASLIQAP